MAKTLDSFSVLIMANATIHNSLNLLILAHAKIPSVQSLTLMAHIILLLDTPAHVQFLHPLTLTITARDKIFIHLRLYFTSHAKILHLFS